MAKTFNSNRRPFNTVRISWQDRQNIILENDVIYNRNVRALMGLYGVVDPVIAANVRVSLEKAALRRAR